MPSPVRAEAGPFAFVLLVFALSAPLWLIGAATNLQLFPGLPVSALMAFCPLIAAADAGKDLVNSRCDHPNCFGGEGRSAL